MTKGNSLQAMLDRAKSAVDLSSTSGINDESLPTVTASGSRRGTKLIGGHFAPEVSTQLRILAAEGGTTIQNLLAEALDDLFVKKGRARIAAV